jgi:hypothetical protein
MDMTRFNPIMNNDNLHHRFIPKIRLRVTRRAIIHPNNFPLKPNQLSHHQISSAAVVLHTAASIGRVVQPYHFTVMLVVIHVVLQKETKKHELLSLRQPALPWSEKMFSKGYMFTVGARLWFLW